MMNSKQAHDVDALRKMAEKNIDKGVLTLSYSGNKKYIVQQLNAALATELICILRYKSHYYKAKGLGEYIAAKEFLEHANEEQAHADMLSERISQLGDVPNYSPNDITNNAHINFVECKTLDEMLHENLVAERIAVEVYRNMIKEINNKDPVTRSILESILSVEEEHLDDIVELKQAR